MIRNDKELIVVGDRVLVKCEDGEERTKVGLYLPSTALDSQAVQGGTIVATGPVDIQTAYYLSLEGIPFDRFYKRDHPVQIQNALVLLRENSKFKTPESVVTFFKLDEELDMSKAELVFEYASVQVYSIPAR